MQRCVGCHSCFTQQPNVFNQNKMVSVYCTVVALCDLKAGGRCDVDKFNP